MGSLRSRGVVGGQWSRAQTVLALGGGAAWRVRWALRNCARDHCPPSTLWGFLRSLGDGSFSLGIGSVRWVGVVASRGLEGDVDLVDRAAPPSYPLAPRERGEGQGEGPHFTRPGPRIARYLHRSHPASPLRASRGRPRGGPGNRTTIERRHPRPRPGLGRSSQISSLTSSKRSHVVRKSRYVSTSRSIFESNGPGRSCRVLVLPATLVVKA